MRGMFERTKAVNARTGAGSRLRFVDRIKQDPFRHYHDVREVIGDRRLKRREQMEVLEAWPQGDDYERGRVELVKEELREIMKGDSDG